MSEKAEDQETASGGSGSSNPDAPGDYESATARLDEIIARLDSGDAQLRETLDLCAEAKAMIEYCATELAAVDEGLKELRLEDLAASLQSGPAAQPGFAASENGPRLGGEVSDGVFEEEVHQAADEPPPPEEPPF
ncbi:MAG: exodeoxyribonuclease VII small subunit [Solirubrobacterales bacterium]